MRYSVDIPVQPGDKISVYEPHPWKLGEPVLYEVTNISITQNKKKQWNKKIRAMRFVNGKTTDYGITLDFEDIGKIAFIKEV